MATYIKGHKNFYPDIKPFTPDYKFLSATLDATQAKYDAGWKAQNDLYNKVVYSPLTNPNSLEYQRQYAEKLGPSLEKITGMDLSLEQNVQAAKSAFAPFFEDEEVVYDMVWTGAYNEAVNKFSSLASSSNEETRQLANIDVGMGKLDIDRRKFMEAGRGELRNQPLPELILDADLVRNAQKYLSALDPGLTISMPVPNLKNSGKVDASGNPILVEDDQFIITQKNGNLIEGAAYEQIMTALYDDPRVQKFYNAKSYVQAHNTAAGLVESGLAPSEQVGLNMWAKEQVSRLEEKNLEYQSKKEYDLRKQTQVNVNWDNYSNNHGVVAGSTDEITMRANLSDAEKIKIDLDRLFKQNQFAQSDDIDEGALMNKAMAMLSNYNMDKDMRTAARQFSLREMEITQEVNPYALERLENRNRRNLQIEKFKFQAIENMRRDEKQFEYDKILKSMEGGSSGSFTNQQRTGLFNNGNAASFTVDEDNKILFTDDPIANDAFEMANNGLKLTRERLGMLPSMLKNSGLYNVEGKVGIYKVPLVTNPNPDNPDDYIIGNLKVVLDKLDNNTIVDELATDNFQYNEGIESLFANLQEYYQDPTAAFKADPNNKEPNSDYAKITKKLFSSGSSIELPGLATKIELHNTAIDLSFKDLYTKGKVIESAFNSTEEKDLSDAEEDIAELLKYNYTLPFNEEDKSFMTREDFYKANKALVDTKNIDVNAEPALNGPINNFDLWTTKNEYIVTDFGTTTISVPVFDDKVFERNLDKIYDYYYKNINKLRSNTNSKTYNNQIAGVFGPASNIRFDQVMSSTVNLNPIAGSDQDLLLGNFYKQVNISGTSGDAGFLGQTTRELDQDDVINISGNALDITNDKSLAAKFIYDRLNTMNAVDKALAMELTFFNSWGATIVDPKTGSITNTPKAAYQLSNFSDAFIKSILSDDITVVRPDGVSAEEINKVLREGFTYIFPRDNTASSNPLSYANAASNTTLEKRINNSENNVYTIKPNAFAAPYFLDNSGTGSVDFEKVGNTIVASGYFNHYESDAEKYPTGYRRQPFTYTLEGEDQGKTGYDTFYDEIITTLTNIQTSNQAQYTAKSNEAKGVNTEAVTN